MSFEKPPGPSMESVAADIQKKIKYLQETMSASDTLYVAKFTGKNWTLEEATSLQEKVAAAVSATDDMLDDWMYTDTKKGPGY